MQKKLLAAAVAGALAVPVGAMAAASGTGSTVQIYGQAEVEYGRIDQGNGRNSADYMESTGSYLGFRGTESLGGGLTAWFQCETTMDIRAFDQTGLCSRNSGVGFRGGFGNIWLGRWHTPFSRIFGMGNPGQEETGILGMSSIHGGSGSTSLAEQGTGNAGALNRQRFRRRESCLTTYETPNFSGVQFGFAISCGNAAADQIGSSTSGGTNTKPRLWSTALTYQQGPLGLGIGYQKHKEVGTFNAAPGSLEPDDRAWGVSGRYAFGSFVLGLTYMDRKWEVAGGDVKNRTWTIAGEWNISGPHVLMAAYGDTGDTKGLAGATIGTGGGGSSGTNPAGSSTGYDSINIAYQYNFSKRTSLKLGWTRYDNDTNSTAHRSFNTSPNNLLGGGQNLDNYAVIVKHRF